MVGSRRIKTPFPEWRTGTESGPPSSLLSPCLAKRRGPHQRLPRIRPSVRMSVVAIVSRQPRLDSFLELGGACEIAPFEEAPAQDTEEQFDLIEP
jgi:hypothetical protein